MDPLHVTTTETTPGVKKVSGQKLARWRKMGLIPPVFAARLADALQVGTVVLSDLTDKQACAVVGATVAGLAAVRRERRKHRATTNGTRVLYRRAQTDGDVDAVVAKIGADRVMQSLDRITRPTLVAAE
jgi:hypothetical protein